MSSMRRVLGIICEYNPFHNGHAYQLQTAREVTRADVVVCVMSGPFTQRGDAALFSPRLRAQMALSSGADVVVELPSSYALREAEFFALGGVSILNALGVTHISFGCENEELTTLQKAALILEKPSSGFQSALRLGLNQGMSHAKAQGEALSSHVDGLHRGIISSPNNVLAICYLRAIHRIGSTMIPVPVKRMGAYHDTNWKEGFASATAVREALRRGDFSFVEKAIPNKASPLLLHAMEHGLYHRPECLDLLLRDRLRTMTHDDLRRYPNVSEGLEHRVASMAPNHTSRRSLLEELKTKRYTYTRLNRLLTHILLDMTVEKLNNCTPSSFRLLGFKASARPYLSSLPEGLLYTKAARQQKDESFLLDMVAYDLWALGASLPLGEGYRQQVAII